MNFIRKCKICDKDILYKTKNSFGIAILKNSNCKRCSALLRPPKSEETKKKISNTLTGRIIPKVVIDKRTTTQKKLFNTPEYKEKLSILRKGKNNGMYGKHHSIKTRKQLSEIIKKSMATPEVKEKMKRIMSSEEYKINKSIAMKKRIRSDEHCRKLRLAHIDRIKNIKCNGKDLSPKFNPVTCQIIDNYGKQNGFHFCHALNGGEHYIKELGYWVDGYDKEKNTVLEIDEKHHFDFNGNLKEKDVRRQKEIEEHLKCKFIRLTNIKEKE